ncbi:hypothetical protein OS493_012525 [Desmophyllum pertusum]|uniref:AMP-dependent synthetase/ligase domain-containing protein n=1 Tax=Desmophyllum pertusum TaxID=174260 RepID=A0A9W9ZGU5_9CNID|nr:hypothetical protein OS493_012525 [Desmophyllum pertusum]
MTDERAEEEEENVIRSKNPDRDSISDRSYSYRQIKDLSRKIASALNKRGFKKGDVFAMFLPNLPEFPVVYFGVLQAGGVVTAANPLFTCEELAKQVKTGRR